jgi:hypothetical protein
MIKIYVHNVKLNSIPGGTYWNAWNPQDIKNSMPKIKKGGGGNLISTGKHKNAWSPIRLIVGLEWRRKICDNPRGNKWV